MSRYYLPPSVPGMSAHPIILVPRARATWVGNTFNGNLFLVETKSHVTMEKKILVVT